MHPREYTCVRDRYPDAYDVVVESNRMPDILYMLKSGSYKQVF